MRFEGIKSTKRILFPLIVTLLLILSSFIMLVASADDVPFDPFNPFPLGGGNVYCPMAYGIQGSSNIGYYDSDKIHNLQEYGRYNTTWGADGDFADFNPRNLDYGSMIYIAGNQYNKSGLYGFIPLYSNITITNVKAIIIAPDHIKTGYFSLKLSTVSTAVAFPWWGWGGISFQPAGAGVDTAYVYNSTLFPHISSTALVPYPANVWDITSKANWTYDLITSIDTYISWTTIGNTTIAGADYIDYIGLWWQYYADFNYTGTWNGTLIPSFSDNFNSILWLLIVFAPALALQYMLPKIGYAFGMFLMLFIFGLTQTNFMYVTIIGISALGIMLYKGD
jgi:hypothetical protein